MRAAQGWRSSGAREVDYGGILIPNSIPASPAWYGGANQAMVPVFVVGYPVDGSVTNGTLWYGQGSLKPEENPTRDDDQWYYEISTRSGQSGGPVFYYDAGSKLAYAIGIHNYGDSPYNFGTRLTTQVLQELASWIP